MPKVTLFVRNDDWESFQRIQDRPEWLHDAIQATSPYKDGKLPFTTLTVQREYEEAIGMAHSITNKASTDMDDMLTMGTVQQQPPPVRIDAATRVSTSYRNPAQSLQ